MASRMSPRVDKIADQIHAFAMQMTEPLTDDEYLATMAAVIELLNASLGSDTSAIQAKKQAQIGK